MMAVITLDGPAGVGKTTLARDVARTLGLPCLDTGAMFRFLALKLGPGLATMPPQELLEKARQWRFDLRGIGEHVELLANGEAIGPEIRTEAASRLASELGKRPEARQILLEAQRALGEGRSLVAEGRDLGTVVFPNAEHKFFLDARPEIRAKRRWLEEKAKGGSAPLAQVEADIRERDERDRNRSVAPLKPAPDAVIIDTSDLTLPEVLAKIMSVISAKAP